MRIARVASTRGQPITRSRGGGTGGCPAGGPFIPALDARRFLAPSCKPLIPGVNAYIDHVYTRSQRQDLSSDLDNLGWCDKWINCMKGYLSYREFIELCRAIVDKDS